MRILILTLFFLGFSNVLIAQGTVTFQENFFNNNRFKIDGIESKPNDVARVMANFESSQKDFLEGHKQMRIGSGLRILGIGVLVGALVNYGLSDFTQDDTRTYFLISLSGMGVGTVGSAIRSKGKSRVETAVSEYNYLKDRGNYKEVSFQAAPGKVGLVFNF
ncbi:hypothetical protein [Algoriphagus marinus]|uniref:hypothetical protein n=1 Tax=Algoriphagus marinus TaxID=1925762 RepID=UPI00094B7D0F|nr:hypothetical protein [Algoriphagus marinus]